MEKMETTKNNYEQIMNKTINKNKLKKRRKGIK